MKRLRCPRSAAALAVLMSACDPNDAPAAQTPTGIDVLAILQNGGGWVNVGRNGDGRFEILPGGSASGAVRVFFDAPWPAGLRVAIDGVPLRRLEDFPSGTAAAVLASEGYYRIVDINPNPTPAKWHIFVRPPAVSGAASMYLLTIAHESLNPNLSGTDRLSAPATIEAVAQRRYLLSVVFAGSGSGRVMITPAGGTTGPTFCNANCVVDFGQSVTATISPNSTQGSRFTGWSGSAGCAGTSTCTITLNGSATAVVANFSGGGASTASACPPVEAVDGYSFFNLPKCALQNAFNDPAPDLLCDAQGYFCCADSSGANDPRCGGAGRQQFPADCHYGNPMVRIEPSGCYIQN